MKANVKQMLSLALATAMGMSLVACGSTDSGAEQPSASETVVTSTETPSTEEASKDYKDTEFRVSWWGGDARNNATVELLEEFEKNYTNLKIDVEYAGYGDHFTKLATQATGNNLPDVFQMDYNYLREYNDNGLLLPLDDYISSGKLDLSQADSNTMAAGVLDGKTVAVVTGVNAPCYFYNTELAEKAGVTISETPTLDEYIEICKTIYDKTGAKAFPIYNQVIWARMMGYNFYSEDGKSLDIPEDVMVSYFNYLKDGYDYGYFANHSEDWNGETDAFAKEIIWCYPDFSNKLETYEQESGKTLAMFAIPSTDKNAAPSYMKPNMLWVVSATCENPDLAVDFLNYFINDTKTYDICGMDRGVPVSNAIRTYMEPNLTEQQKQVNDFLTVLSDGHSSATPAPDPAGAGEITTIFQEYWENVDYGNLKPDDFESAAKEAIEKMNACLAD